MWIYALLLIVYLGSSVTFAQSQPDLQGAIPLVAQGNENFGGKIKIKRDELNSSVTRIFKFPTPIQGAYELDVTGQTSTYPGTCKVVNSKEDWIYSENGVLFSTPGYFHNSSLAFIEITLNFSESSCQEFEWSFHIGPAYFTDQFLHDQLSTLANSPRIDALVRPIESRNIALPLIYKDLSTSTETRLQYYFMVTEFNQEYGYDVHEDFSISGVIKKYGSNCKVEQISNGWYNYENGAFIPYSQFGYLTKYYSGVQNGGNYFYRGEYSIKNSDGCVGYINELLLERREVR